MGSRRVKTLLAAAAALAGGAAVLAGVALSTGSSDRAPAGNPFRGTKAVPGISLPSFALRDHRGRTLTSSELRGRVVLLTFLDSQCKEACPVIAAALARGVDALSARERAGVVAVAISVDPREDTRAGVTRFLAARRATGRIRYLVAPAGELRRLWQEFQILPSARTGNDSLHSAPLRIYSRDGVWRATLHAGADLSHANLLHDVRVALALPG